MYRFHYYADINMYYLIFYRRRYVTSFIYHFFSRCVHRTVQVNVEQTIMGSKISPCFVSGTIIKGFGRGSKALGIPTANLPESVINALPKDLNTGIYYGWASLNGKVYKMVASIGWNPYYKNEKKSMEVHILHKFQHDFYGEELKFIISGYIRPEKDFTSLDELIAEIKNDIAIAERQLEEPNVNKLKNDDFLMIKTNH